VGFAHFESILTSRRAGYLDCFLHAEFQICDERKHHKCAAKDAAAVRYSHRAHKALTPNRQTADDAARCQSKNHTVISFHCFWR
jgi:hypothetical protein